jgi:hypothetical protein
MLLERQTIVQLSKNSSSFVEPEGHCPAQKGLPVVPFPDVTSQSVYLYSVLIRTSVI